MGTIRPLVKEINQYLTQLNNEQQRAVLGIVKTFAKEDAWLDDKKYIAEMDRRFAEMEKTKTKGITLDVLEKKTRQSYKNNKAKKG